MRIADVVGIQNADVRKRWSEMKTLFNFRRDILGFGESDGGRGGTEPIEEVRCSQITFLNNSRRCGTRSTRRKDGGGMRG